MKKNPKRRWQDLSIRNKLLAAFALTSLLMFAINLFMYWQVNKTIKRIDEVYVSNVSLNQLSDAFIQVHSDVYAYLTVKSSDALENYYRSEQNYKEQIEQLNSDIVDSDMLMLEKNIRSMSQTYLAVAGEAVQAKRGRNVEKYKASYEESVGLYNYINTYVNRLSNLHFKSNASSYQILLRSLQYLEVVSSVILLAITLINVVILMLITRNITRPLARLAESAHLVGEGNFQAEVPQTDAKDEIGIVTRAFNKMVHSLKEYIDKTRESMEKERQMKERELLMETHLKDAQLKYLQSQINPHFLFNSLNAGAQLAMMEDAEKTCLFVERMADFFRYNVKKVSEDATLREEVASVDNYIYILNVRFAGDIHFSKTIEESALDQKVPSMVLQPLVENAVNHGIRNIDWQGTIHLDVRCEGGFVRVSIKDNGKGMTKERIDKVLRGGMRESSGTEDSTGIGMDNVISRLELYYNRKDLMQIVSEGENKGTEIIVLLPVDQIKG